MTYRNRKLLDSARDADCMLALPDVCNGGLATAVWAHLRGLRYGKGMGHKPHDLFGFYACSACHDVYDGRRKTELSREWLQRQAEAACLASLIIAADRGVL